MKTGQITQNYDISRDTLRFYMEQGLLTPQLKNGKYDWSQQDLEDLENVLHLRQLGFSAKAILRFKEVHDAYCGTPRQWQENKEVIEEEIRDKDAKIAKLLAEKEDLLQLHAQLEDKLKESE